MVEIAKLAARNAVPLIFVAIVLAALLAGCTTTKGSFCQISKPIRLSDETVDHLSDAEVAAILSHNEKGAALCRWKP